MRVSMMFALVVWSLPAAAQLSDVGHLAVVSVDGRVGSEPFDQFKDAGGNLVGTISAATEFSRSLKDGTANSITVSGLSSIVASLTALNKGSVLFNQHLSVDQQIATSTSANLDGAVRGFGTYTYGFTTRSDARFQFTYDLSSFGYTAALTTPAQFGFLKEDNTGEFAFLSDPLGNGARGSISATIHPGTYSFNIQDFYANEANPSSASAGLIGRYGFSISAIPEPASWAMMIGGFGLIGGVMRRQRKAKTSVRFA